MSKSGNESPKLVVGEASRMGMSPLSLLVAAYDIGGGVMDFIRCNHDGYSMSIHIEKTEGGWRANTAFPRTPSWFGPELDTPEAVLLWLQMNCELWNAWR